MSELHWDQYRPVDKGFHFEVRRASTVAPNWDRIAKAGD